MFCRIRFYISGKETFTITRVLGSETGIQCKKPRGQWKHNILFVINFIKRVKVSNWPQVAHKLWKPIYFSALKTNEARLVAWTKTLETRHQCFTKGDNVLSHRTIIEQWTTRHELLTLQDERQVSPECSYSLEAIFAPNCRALVDATFHRLVLKEKQESS